MSINKKTMGLLALACAGGLGYLVVQKLQQAPEAGMQAPMAAKKDLTVDAMVVRTRPVQVTLQVLGTLLANEEVEIRPEVGGRIVRIHAREGQQVAKGALLFELNDAELQAQLQRVQAQMRLSETTLERYRQLLPLKGVTQQEVDAAENQLATQKADAALLRAQIAKTEIRAPFSGVLGLRQVSEGAIVTNSTPLTTLQQTQTLKLDFFVPERYASHFATGNTFSFQKEGKTYQARVLAKEGRVDASSRNLKLRAQVVGNTQGLMAGSSAQLLLTLGEDDKALMVPSNAIIPEARGKKVVRANGGKAEFVEVTTGLRESKDVQLLSGIAEGDTLIVSGILQLRPEAPIKIRQVK